MRRVHAAGLFALVAVLPGCSPAEVPAPTPDDRLAVVATFTVMADIVAQVGGSHVHVTALTGPGMNVHGYEPTPEDLRRAAEADLVVANGWGLESTLMAMLAPLDRPTVVLTDGLDPLPVHGTASETAGTAWNPHGWVSPTSGRHYVQRVADVLADVDPANAPEYRARAAELVVELERMHHELVARLADVPADRRVLVTCEGAFAYLARDVGLREVYLWPVNAERQGTPRQVAATIDAVQEAGVPAVFCEWSVPDTAARQVARETGARYAGNLYVDSLTGPDGPVPTWFDLIEHNTEMIVSALTEEDR